MMARTQNKKSAALKLAQLLNASDMSIETINEILEKEGDINFAIPDDGPYIISRSCEIGNTALHYACKIDNFDLFMSLLNLRADFTIKNKDGQTVLHLVLAKHQDINELSDNPFINAVFSAHVNLNIISNPKNKDGLSHFHIACLTNNSRAAQLFLENGVSVEEPISMVSTFLPGCTPLHLAVMSASTQVAELLLAYGATIYRTDVRDMTPLHVLIECRIHMYNSIGDALRQEGNSYEKLQEQIGENEKIINVLLENMSSDNDCLDSIGLSNFHVACLLQDTSVAQNLVDQVTDLDQCVNMDSPLFPGYTALHFAAHVSLNTVEMLINEGANIEVRDLEGLTPLDICVERYKIEDVCKIMSLNENWNNILFSDGQTKLISAIQGLANRDEFGNAMDNQNVHAIPKMNIQLFENSPIWPGYTPFHLAVLFADRPKRMFDEDARTSLQIIKLCLNRRADLNAQDAKGQTALHLAFRLGKMRVVEMIFDHYFRIANVSDLDNLSHLHIACATNKENYLKEFVLNKLAVNAVYRGTSSINNVRRGSTPLHVCLVNPKDVIDLKDRIRVLLKFGADISIKDIYGLTPIHRILELSSPLDYRDAINQLIAKVSNDCAAKEYGISYLHIASILGNESAVKRLIQNGANVNLAIKPKRDEDAALSFLTRYEKCTPLHLTNLTCSDVYKVLIKHNANVFAKKADGSTPLSFTPILTDYITKVRTDKEKNLKGRMKRDYGWTRLHFMCLSLDDAGIILELVYVNAKVNSNSPVWKGYTPLHLLMYKAQNFYKTTDDVYTMSKALLKEEADVTVMNDEQDTPITMLFNARFVKHEMYKLAALLIRHHKDFNVNPVNAQGISHFHIACYVNDAFIVEKFISHGVDVNSPIDYFGNWCPGFTPLHLAAELPVVDLLIKHRADVTSEDANGCNVLAESLSRDSFHGNAVTKIIQKGASIDGTNFRGQTPFEYAISKGPITMEKLNYCINHGFLVNSCNTITGHSYIATILKQHYQDLGVKMRIVKTIMNENSTVDQGRTTMHNIVSGPNSDLLPCYYAVLFEMLIEKGYDIDEHDDEGMTALHVAVKFKNQNAVVGLLEVGANINFPDMYGKPPILYTSSQSTTLDLEPKREYIRKKLIERIWELTGLNWSLCQINTDAIARMTIRDFPHGADFIRQVTASQTMQIGVRTLCLFDFLIENSAVAVYRTLNQSDRSKVDEYFQSIIDDARVKEIRNILKMQYRNAARRIELFSLAVNSYRLLLGFDLPDLCAENLFQYLCNSDLTNIVRAEIINRKLQMELFSSAMKSFRLLLGFVLPDMCVENIFQYLYNCDLKNIIRAEIANRVVEPMDVE